MSRIAKYPVPVPQGVEATISAGQIAVKGPLGSLTQDLNGDVVVRQEDGQLTFAVANDSRQAKAMSGTLRALVANMVTGVSKGFERRLNLVGVGFRAQVQGDALKLQLGFSHDIVHEMPAGIKVECPTQTEIVIKGSNKQVVGQVAAEIRAYREPEPYKGKGVRYADERVIIKETKKKLARRQGRIMDKKISRLRRAVATRRKISELRVHRLSIYRSNLHIYANIISPEGDRVLVSASTLEPEVRKELAGKNVNGGNTAAAGLVGKRVAEKAKAAGIELVAFDRSGFRYHGRVKALADAAREAGLKF